MNLPYEVYRHLPPTLQHVAFSTFGIYWHWLRFGPGHKREVALFREREVYNSEQWKRWTKQELTELLTHCVESVPFYMQTWSKREKAAAIEGQVTELPLLEKDDVRQYPHALERSDWRPFKRSYLYTSGTTGTPVISIWTIGEARRSLAIREVRAANWAGVSYSMPRATISGRVLVTDPDTGGPFHRYNLVERQVYQSPYHLKPQNASAYLEPLSRHQTVWLNGYASSYYMLAQYMLDQDLKPPPSLRAVVTVAEKLTPKMRRVMEAAYDCPVFEEYSSVENVCYVSQCESGRLHVSPDAGYLEILRPDGDPCEPGEVGEIVCTGLLRRYQPFVRYRIGDMGAWGGEPCPCGREMPVIQEIVGRKDDVVVGPDGRRLARLNTVFEHIARIREAQTVQEDNSSFTVHVVPADGFGPKEANDVVREIQARLGSSVAVRVQEVDQIPRDKNGKFRAVISRVGEEYPSQ